MKHTQYLCTLLVALFLINTGLAQTAQDRYIDVNGSAEMEVTPDIIKLSVTLTEYENERRVVSLNEIEAGFLKAVDESEIPQDKIAVTRVASNAYNTKRKRKAFASKTYELTFSDQKGLLNFTKRLKNTDIANLYISHLNHTNMAELRLLVKKEALLAAKVKAKVLVEAVDAKLGQILSINEGYSFGRPWTPQNNAYSNTMLRMEADTRSLEADDIGFKKIKLRYEVSARFMIE